MGGSGWQWVVSGGWWCAHLFTTLVVLSGAVSALRTACMACIWCYSRSKQREALRPPLACTTSQSVSVFYSALERDWPWLSHAQSLLRVGCAEPAAVQSPGNPAFKCPSFCMPTTGKKVQGAGGQEIEIQIRNSIFKFEILI